MAYDECCEVVLQRGLKFPQTSLGHNQCRRRMVHNTVAQSHTPEASSGHPIEEPYIENPIASEKEVDMIALQNNALLLLLFLGQKGSTGGMFENLADSLIRLC